MTLYASSSLKGFFDSDIHRTLPSDAVEITTEYHQGILEAQSSGLTIDWSGSVPVAVAPPEPTLADKQSHIWSLIKAERDRRTQEGGCLVDSNWFHTDTFSRSQWLGIKDQARDLLAAGGAMTDPIQKQGTQVQWKTMNGSFVPVTIQLAFDVVAALGDSDAAIFEAAEIHKAAMMNTALPEAYDYLKGWPVSYGEVV